MSTPALNPPGTADSGFEPATVSVRSKISGLWTAMLFIFAYVDIFGLYRPDVRADIEAGEVGGFTIGRSFLLATTVYILIPSLMVFGVLVLRPTVNRIVNLVLSPVYALTIVAAAIGEWSYYVLGSVIEVGLLAAVAYLAWTWPRLARPPAEDRPEVAAPMRGTAP